MAGNGKPDKTMLRVSRERRRLLRTASVATGVAYVAPKTTMAAADDQLSPCFGLDCALGNLVSEVDAVYPSTIPPSFYARQFVSVGAIVPINGASDVRIQAPDHPEYPYGYGSGAQYALFHDSGANLYSACFNSAGIFHTIIDGTITTVFVGSPVEEKGGQGKTGCTETFSVSDADLVLSDRIGSHAARWDYYKDDLGQTVVAVNDVADAVAAICTHVANNGKLNKLTIANHANKGIISLGAGSGANPTKEIGKDAANSAVGAYQALLNGFQGKFNAGSELCLIGCYVGEGPEGQNLVSCLAADIGGDIKVKAKKGAVSYPLRWYLTARYASSSGEKGWTES